MQFWVLFQILKYSSIFLLLGVQLYFYRAIRRMLKHDPRFERLLPFVTGIFILFSLPLAIAVFWVPFVSRIPALWLFLGLYPLYCWHVTWMILFLGAVVRGIVRGIFRLVRRAMQRGKRLPLQSHDAMPAEISSRRRFLRQGSIAAAGVLFSGAAYGAAFHDRVELTEETIVIPRLPKSFHGYRIAFLSDIHSSVFMTKEMMRHAVDVANDVKPDLIVVTGDFVNSSYEEVFPFAETFTDLRARDGIFGVLGNHDYYTRRVEDVATVVNECGIRLLRNESVSLARNGDRILLSGVDDVGNPHRAANLFERALENSDRSLTKLLLCHRPYFFPQAAVRSFDLTLSGHTHGGQIVLARLGNDVIAPARIASPYVAGLYRLGDAQMYVSRGIGTVAIPMRINCPAEITLVTLAGERAA